MTLEKMIDLLPYHLQQGENINKILKVFSAILDECTEITEQIQDIGNIDSNGDILDYTGSIVSVYRNGDTDDNFRDRIKTKIVRNFSKGDIETINGLGNVLLGDNYVGVIENHSLPEKNEKVGLTLVYNFTNVEKNPTSIMKTAVAGGVGLDTKLQVYNYVTGLYEYGVTNLTQFPTLINP